jgi:hypothetical protein
VGEDAIQQESREAQQQGLCDDQWQKCTDRVPVVLLTCTGAVYANSKSCSSTNMGHVASVRTLWSTREANMSTWHAAASICIDNMLHTSTDCLTPCSPCATRQPTSPASPTPCKAIQAVHQEKVAVHREGTAAVRPPSMCCWRHMAAVRSMTQPSSTHSWR